MVTLECVEKLIRKDMVDPVNGEKLTDQDIIVLQRVSRDPPPQDPAPGPLPMPNPALPPPRPTPAFLSWGPASPCGLRIPPQRALQPDLPPPWPCPHLPRAAPASRAPE